MPFSAFQGGSLGSMIGRSADISSPLLQMGQVRYSWLERSQWQMQCQLKYQNKYQNRWPQGVTTGLVATSMQTWHWYISYIADSSQQFMFDNRLLTSSLQIESFKSRGSQLSRYRLYQLHFYKVQRGVINQLHFYKVQRGVMKALKKKDESDFIVKIVIIGDSGVGKTNILVRFCDGDFKMSYSATIGVDFKIKVINIEGCKIKLQIWDTAGQERYKNINQTYYRGAIGIILAYSITDRSSFENVENWIKQIHEHASSDVIKFLVGNKSDLRNERQVDVEQGEKLAAKFDMTFMEVSAKDGSNIEQLFTELGRQVHANIKQNTQKEQGRFSITKEEHQESGEEQQNGCKC